MEIKKEWYLNNYESRLKNRYISAAMVDAIIKDYGAKLDSKILGYSVEKRPVYAIQLGNGPRRILMWSQMHGNESTTTKAVFDLIKFALSETIPLSVATILKKCTLCIIPQLNPDGATAYSRENANKVDLNRDAAKNTQAEMQLLKDAINTFSPELCFNLHGQRTIYGFKDTRTSSALSFLAPAADKDRSVTLSRKRAMTIINEMYTALSVALPEQIGRYDDAFNSNCIGDHLMSRQLPTILFEAGHIRGDYAREDIRYYVCNALIIAIQAYHLEKKTNENAYFEIPEHQKCFVDIVITNTADGDITIQYEERLEDGQIVFAPIVQSLGIGSATLAHRQIDGLGKKYTHINGDAIGLGDVIGSIIAEDASTITLS